VALGFLAIASAAIPSMLRPGPLANHHVGRNPLGVPALGGAFRAWSAIGPPLVLASLAVGVAALVARWLREPRGSLGRRQITLVALAAMLVIFVVAQPGPDGLSDLVSGLLILALVPAAIGYAILRRRLYNLDLAVNRSLV